MIEPEPYLILHRVRGLAAFDIAHQIEMEDEECWIIPTSGHRAYPYWWIAIKEIPDIECLLQSTPSTMPDDWPDHYTANKAPPEAKLEAKSLLASLGLPTTTHNAMSGKLTRRI